MISCTEFIPAYSELFKCIERLAGREGVADYWVSLSDTYVKERLGKLAGEKGIMGCWEYWEKSLNEEAADFTMEVDDEAGVFRIHMRYCPSKGRLLETEHIEPYHDYCGHCDPLYRHVLEPLGFSYSYDMADTDRAACCLEVKKAP